mmetsp:Transcript_1785/g.5459  ORF Transcript_1785/g.5459 Transcript_1785/m.5459 type:complete len:256 (-) Transcript_1785:849-1616(-)
MRLDLVHHRPDVLGEVAYETALGKVTVQVLLLLCSLRDVAPALLRAAGIEAFDDDEPRIVHPPGLANVSRGDDARELVAVHACSDHHHRKAVSTLILHRRFGILLVHARVLGVPVFLALLTATVLVLRGVRVAVRRTCCAQLVGVHRVDDVYMPSLGELAADGAVARAKAAVHHDTVLKHLERIEFDARLSDSLLDRFLNGLHVDFVRCFALAVVGLRAGARTRVPVPQVERELLCSPLPSRIQIERGPLVIVGL